MDNKLNPKTVKWLVRQMRHKKWGKYRYSRSGKAWVIQKLIGMGWYYGENISKEGFMVYDFDSEWDCINAIRVDRNKTIIDWCQQQRKKKAYSKRKWWYLP